MKKRILAVMLSGCMMLDLVGCSKKEQAATNTSENAPEESIEAVEKGEDSLSPVKLTSLVRTEFAAQKVNGYKESPSYGFINGEMTPVYIEKQSFTDSNPYLAEFYEQDQNTGISIYRYLEDGNFSDYPYRHYIYSGYQMVNLNENVLDETTMQEIHILRDEKDYHRIRLFYDKEKLNQQIQNWNDGQAILNGEMLPGDEGVIILNGCVVPDAHVGDYNGELGLPLYQIAEAYSEYSYYDDISAALCIPLDSDSAMNFTNSGYQNIPSDQTNNGYASYFGSFEFGDWQGVFGDASKYVYVKDEPAYQDYIFNLGRPLTSEYFWYSPSNIANVLGWDIYANEDNSIISIVTDELDVSNDFRYIPCDDPDTAYYNMVPHGGEYTELDDGSIRYEDGTIVKDYSLEEFFDGEEIIEDADNDDEPEN